MLQKFSFFFVDKNEINLHEKEIDTKIFLLDIKFTCMCYEIFMYI